MSAPQIIRTPGGEELVVLPRAEYEALLERADHEAEDADDVAIYDARKAELAAGGVVLPPEVSAAILRGESRLKAIRNWRGETQLYLNFKTGIGQGYLSDLEWAPHGNPRNDREARPGFESAGGVALVLTVAAKPLRPLARSARERCTAPLATGTGPSRRMRRWLAGVRACRRVAPRVGPGYRAPAPGLRRCRGRPAGPPRPTSQTGRLQN